MDGHPLQPAAYHLHPRLKGEAAAITETLGWVSQIKKEENLIWKESLPFFFLITIKRFHQEQSGKQI